MSLVIEELGKEFVSCKSKSMRYYWGDLTGAAWNFFSVVALDLTIRDLGLPLIVRDLVLGLSVVVQFYLYYGTNPRTAFSPPVAIAQEWSITKKWGTFLKNVIWILFFHIVGCLLGLGAILASFPNAESRLTSGEMLTSLLPVIGSSDNRYAVILSQMFFSFLFIGTILKYSYIIRHAELHDTDNSAEVLKYYESEQSEELAFVSVYKPRSGFGPLIIGFVFSFLSVCSLTNSNTLFNPLIPFILSWFSSMKTVHAYSWTGEISGAILAVISYKMVDMYGLWGTGRVGLEIVKKKTKKNKETTVTEQQGGYSQINSVETKHTTLEIRETQ
jgi:glycerol uptake facilitator-like aquaporin